MTANYFYQKLLNYDKESNQSKKYYYGYENGYISIHHKGNEREYFNVYRNGNVTHYCDYEMIMSIDISHISDLTGDDFEIYNRVQIFKSGYIVLETDEKDIDNLVITGLYNFINMMTEDILGKTLPPFTCGITNFRHGLTDEIHYSSRQNIEVEVQSINLFRNFNTARKYYDLNPIPFIPRIKNKEAIHVNFIDIVSNFRDISDTNKCCEDALTDLMHYLQLVDVVKELGIKCKWIETKMKKPIYC